MRKLFLLIGVIFLMQGYYCFANAAEPIFLIPNEPLISFENSKTDSPNDVISPYSVFEWSDTFMDVQQKVCSMGGSFNLRIDEKKYTKEEFCSKYINPFAGSDPSWLEYLAKSGIQMDKQRLIRAGRSIIIDSVVIMESDYEITLKFEPLNKDSILGAYQEMPLKFTSTSYEMSGKTYVAPLLLTLIELRAKDYTSGMQNRSKICNVLMKKYPNFKFETDERNYCSISSKGTWVKADLGKIYYGGSEYILKKYEGIFKKYQKTAPPRSNDGSDKL
jgi:hypothetical protein